MRVSKTLCIVLGVLFCLTAFGCGAKSDPAYALPAGFSSYGTLVSGGKDTGDVNAKSLTVSTQYNQEKSVEETVLTFQFVTGSRISGGTEELEGCGVPAYTIYTLDHPSRLVVEFQLLAHWDYSHGLEVSNSLIQGCFQHSVADDPRVSVVFQLCNPVFFSADEKGDTLSIRLLPQQEEEEPVERYYVTVNAYSAYCEGSLSRDFGLAPTLASDGQNILLISSPFETQEDAQEYMMNGQLQFPQIPVEQWQTMPLSDGSLPEYRLDLEHIQAYQTPAIRYGGVETVLPVMVPNGLYLCQEPGGGFLYTQELAAGESGDTYQQLWIMDASGTSRLLTPFEFAAVEQAQFSPDGRKLAILERASGNSHLYVFDTDTYELLNDLSEMGFGNNTSKFIWNSMGNIIYAITGTSGMQLHQFDYSIPDETRRHTIVDKNSVDEGGLGFYDGELYFCNSTMEEGARIFRIKPEGGIRKPFADGSAFAISADARYMAILSSSETGGDSQSGQSLTVYNLPTGETSLVTSDFFPYDILWSEDCKTLYYIESRISGGQTEDETSSEQDNDGEASPEQADNTDTVSSQPADPYPYTLWAYDVATATSTQLLDLCAPDVFTSSASGTLYLNRYDVDEAGLGLRACYQLDLNALFTAQPAEAEEAQATPLA